MKTIKSIALFILIMTLLISSVIPVMAETYKYGKMGRLSEVVFDNGDMVTYNYDSKGNMIEITSNAFAAEDKIEAFVKRIYWNVLGREADPEGLGFWSNGLRSGDENASGVIYEFFFGPEFIEKDVEDRDFITIAYRTFMNREPDDGGMAHWLHTLQSGFNRRYVLEQMIISGEFIGICASYGIDLGAVIGVDGFVARMYRNVLGRKYEQGGLDFWVANLLNGNETGATIVTNFFYSDEFLNRNVANKVFIEITYNTLMNRDADPEGMTYWMGLLESGVERRVVLGNMVDSVEFKEICENYGIEAGQLITIPLPSENFAIASGHTWGSEQTTVVKLSYIDYNALTNEDMSFSNQNQLAEEAEAGQENREDNTLGNEDIGLDKWEEYAINEQGEITSSIELEISEPYTIGRSLYRYKDASLLIRWFPANEPSKIFAICTFSATFMYNSDEKLAECISVHERVDPGHVSFPGYEVKAFSGIENKPNLGVGYVINELYENSNLEIQTRVELNCDYNGNITNVGGGNHKTGGIPGNLGYLPHDPNEIPHRIIDPVDLINGNLTWEYTDLELYGSQRLSFERYYNSLTAKKTSIGYGWRHSFDYGLVFDEFSAYVTVPNGFEYEFIHNGFSITAQSPNTSLQIIMGEGYLFTSQDETQIKFNVHGKVTQITDVNDNVITMSYNADGLLERVTNKSGSLFFEYINDEISAVMDDNNRKVYYDYYPNGNLREFKNADGDTLVYEYEADNKYHLTTVTDFNKNTYMRNRYEYGRVVEQYLADQGTSYFAYYPQERKTVYTNTFEKRETYYYDENHKIIRVEEEDGGKRRSQVFENGFLRSSTDYRQYTTTYGYDENGNRNLISYPDNTTERYVYNNNRLVTKAIWRDNSETEYNYDNHGKVIAIKQTKNGESHTRSFRYDNDQNLIEYKDATGIITKYSNYDAKGNCWLVTDALGNTLMAYEYDNIGRLNAEITVTGERTEFEYSLAGKLKKTTKIHPNDSTQNIIQTFNSNGNGYNETVIDPEGNVTKTVYDKMNNPTSITDGEGNTVFYEYDKMGNIKKITEGVKNAYNSLGEIIIDPSRLKAMTLDHDSKGLLKRREDFNNHVWEYDYNANGQLARIVNPLNGHKTEMDYDAMGNLKYIKNARGATTHFDEYDALGRVKRITNELGDRVRYEYDINGNLSLFTDAREKNWQYKYDSENRLIETISPENNKTTYQYNSLGQLGNIVTHLGSCADNCHGDATDAIYRFAYDAAGRLKSEADPKGNVYENFYDVFGRLERRKNNTDNTEVSFTYYKNNWLESETDENLIRTSYTYYKNGLIETIKKTQGGATVTTSKYDYDANGRVRFVTNLWGNKTEYVYDGNGNVRFIRNKVSGQIIETEYQYDFLNRLAAIIDAEKGKKEFKYDENDNLTEIKQYKDGQQQTESFKYDLLDRLEEYTDKNRETTTFKYDPNGNVVRVIDAQGNPSFYEYDSLNQLKKVTMYRATEEQIAGYQYSADGLSLTNANGAEAQVMRYEYDERGLLTKTINPKIDEKIYRYDLNGNLEYIKDEDGNESNYAFNTKNLLCTVEYQDGKKAQYLYDSGGRLREVKDWTGATIFELDLLGRIEKVNQKDNQQNNRETKYTYSDTLNQMTLTYPDNSIAKYSLDEINRLTSVRDASNNLIAGYQYDKVNRLKRLDYGNGLAERYEYDALGQLLETYELLNGQESLLYKYAYYDDGNIKESYVRDAVEGTLPESAINEYNVLDQLTSKIQKDGSIIDYTYDKRGNLIRETDRATGKALRSFDYDATNRMVKATSVNGEVSEYTYNPLGYLVSHNGTSQVPDYTSYTQRVLQDGNKSFVYGLDMISVSAPTAKEYVQTDRLGSAVKGRDANGNVTSQIHYSEWGAPTVVIQGLVTPNYTGHVWDSSLGVYYAKARFYDPNIMRFQAVDPARNGTNWYAYASNNPVNRVDPLGLIDVMVEYIAAKNRGKVNSTYSGVIGVTINDETRWTTDIKTVTIVDGSTYTTVDSNWLIARFGLDENSATHQAGDPFNTMDSAALASALMLNPKSFKRFESAPHGREYGANIYFNKGFCPDESDSFTFQQVVEGYDDGVSIRLEKSNEKLFGQLVANFHTHAAGKHGYTIDPVYRNDPGFSPNDLKKATVTQYVATPLGNLFRSDFVSKSWGKSTFRGVNNGEPISRSLPYDPRDNWLR